MKQNKQAWGRRGYLAAATVLAVALVAVLNLMAGQLPASVRELDLTDNGIYQISDTSRDLLAGLEQDVEIVVLAEEGAMDERITRFLELYQALSDHITVTQVDPVASPAQAAQYDAQAGSLIVSCEETGCSRTLASTDLIVYEMDYTYWYSYESAFDAEGQLTSAVSYVTSDDTETVYTLSGHGEADLPALLSEDLEKANLTVEALTLLTEGAVPEDASLVLVNAPATDLAAEEVQMLEDYLTGGGHLLLLLGEEGGALPNLESLLARAGLEMARGYIADPQSYYRSVQGGQSYYYLSPLFSAGSSIAGDLTGDTQFMLLQARGMVQADTPPEDVVVEAVLTTSDGAYAVTAEEQIQGQYLLAAVSTVGEEGGTLTAFSSALINEVVLTYYPSMGNEALFLNAVTANMDQSGTISIPSKSLTETFNTVSGSGVISLLFVVVLPLAVLLYGLATWIRRRRR